MANKNEETGVIMRIQKQSGCLLIVIGAAMLAFVLTDLLKSGPSVFSGSQNVVGEIAGENISYEDYSRKVESLKQFYQEDLGGAGDEQQFREMAWNQIIQEKLIKKEHRALGLTMGAEEFKDLTTGANPDASIIQAFQDPETKTFNRNQLINFLEVQMQEDDRKYRIWYNYYEIPLRERVEGEKYAKMVKSGVYATTLDAQSKLDEKNLEYSATAVGLDYTTINDSTISYTERDLKSYLSKNSDKYQQEASRDIDFVVLNVFPSSEDTLEAKKWADGLVEKFKLASNDSTFVLNYRSSTQFDATFKKRGEFPPNVEDQLFAADTGEVIGPVYFDGTFSLFKISGIGQDTVPSMRARHVLISVADAGPEAEGLAKGRVLMAQLRSGAKDFATEAANNYDGTGATSGDLGWMPELGGTSIPEELRTEIFKRNKGDWFVTRTPRGIHVVQVTEGRSTKAIQVAVASRTVSPGSKADQEISRLAAEIQYAAQENDDFMGVVEDNDQRVREATKIALENPVIPGVSDTKETIRWLYDSKTKVGSISDVIDLQDRYIVAKCRSIREKGTAQIDDVRDVLIADYLKDKKSALLSAQFEEALKKTQDPEEIAKELSTVVRTIPTLNLTSPAVMGIGTDAKIHGAILGMKEGNRSKPLQGVKGVYVIWHNGQVKSRESELPLEEVKLDMNNEAGQNIDAGVLQALRAKGTIVDNRFRFY